MLIKTLRDGWTDDCVCSVLLEAAQAPQLLVAFL